MGRQIVSTSKAATPPVTYSQAVMTAGAAILEEAGSSIEKIVSATVILADEEDFGGMTG